MNKNELIKKIAQQIYEAEKWTDEQIKTITDKNDILIWTGIVQGLDNAWNIVMEHYEEGD